jgi:hypothetical protein
MKWYIEIQVNGSHVGMPVNQWCKILTEKGDGRLVCESLGDSEKIWVIDPNEIIGVRLTEETRIFVTTHGVTRSDQ